MTTSLDPQAPQAKTPDAAILHPGGAATLLSQIDVPWFVVAILVALPLIFNAIALFPEVQKGSTRPLEAKNMQLMTESKVL